MPLIRNDVEEDDYESLHHYHLVSQSDLIPPPTAPLSAPEKDKYDHHQREEPEDNKGWEGKEEGEDEEVKIRPHLQKQQKCVKQDD